jgi:hypothetical protein
MRHLLLVVPLLWGSVPAAQAQVSVGIGVSVPGLSIGINLPFYPEFQRVPGYPVYYAPQAPGNYFFFDGLYWVFHGDEWYASGWYNGPWRPVARYDVPAYMLRVPVRYYRQPPVYFRDWRADAPPRWGDHWGTDWQQRRDGWDRWDHRDRQAAPAPLPDYQRKYPQSRYPQDAGQQQTIRSEHYRYQPREPVARQDYQRPDRPSAGPAPRQAMPRPAMPPQARPMDGAPAPSMSPRREDPRGAPPTRGKPADRDDPADRGRDKKDEVSGG